MILVSKREKNKLLENGCEFHKDIFRTFSRYPKYYLVETSCNLKKLDKIKKEYTAI